MHISWRPIHIYPQRPKLVSVRGHFFPCSEVRLVKHPGVVASPNAGADGGEPISEAISEMSLIGPPDGTEADLCWSTERLLAVIRSPSCRLPSPPLDHIYEGIFSPVPGS